MPKVSVIVPVHNGERYLLGALASVLGQTYTDFEVIVVDDGSTDRSRELISALQGLIRDVYQPTSGVAGARNRGFLRSCGEFIAFLDQDDRWYAHKLETQVGILDRHPNIAVVYCDADTIDETGQIIQMHSLGAVPRPAFLRRFSEFPHPHPFPSTVLMRQDVFSLAGMFDPGFTGTCHEDTELWFRIARRNLGKFHFHPESLVQRRQHAAQGGRDRQSREDNWIVCLDKLMELYESDAKRVRTLKHMLASTYRHQGKHLIKNGEWQKGRTFLKKSLECEPWNWKNLLQYTRAMVQPETHQTGADYMPPRRKSPGKKKHV